MATTKKAKTTNHKETKKLSPITKITNRIGTKGGATMAAGAVGAVVGGALGAAAGVLLTDEQRRETTFKVANTLRTQAVDMLDKTAEQSEKVQKVSKKLAKTAK